jgi:argininosuccinate synthase
MNLETAPIVLAYSGGLDTSFCIPWLKERYERPVVTATINTGGIDDDAASDLERRALALGASRHILVEARDAFFAQVIRFLIMGNVRRGHLYPLCVGAERGIQASFLAKLASELRSETVAHGCTAAGNDQVRFEIALKTLSPNLEVLAPVRDHSWARQDQLDYLDKHGLPRPPSGSTYSINRGLWGVTIGGRETLDSVGSIPESAWVLSAAALTQPRAASNLTLSFKAGVPVAIDGNQLDPVVLIETLEARGAAYGIGRGIHLGDTILGTKGRVAFEAPAADILLAAHRELEKLTLTALQQKIKDQVAASYGDFIHEGKQLDAVCRDIEALLLSSQNRVTGQVHMTLRPGQAFVDGVESPHSLLAASRGSYGEETGEWTAADAVGFSRVLAIPGILQSRAEDG